MRYEKAFAERSYVEAFFFGGRPFRTSRVRGGSNSSPTGMRSTDAKGDKITIRGKVTGMVMMSVMIDACEFEE